MAAMQAKELNSTSSLARNLHNNNNHNNHRNSIHHQSGPTIDSNSSTNSSSSNSSLVDSSTSSSSSTSTAINNQISISSNNHHNNNINNDNNNSSSMTNMNSSNDSNDEMANDSSMVQSETIGQSSSTTTTNNNNNHSAESIGENIGNTNNNNTNIKNNNLNNNNNNNSKSLLLPLDESNSNNNNNNNNNNKNGTSGSTSVPMQSIQSDQIDMSHNHHSHHHHNNNNHNPQSSSSSSGMIGEGQNQQSQQLLANIHRNNLVGNDAGMDGNGVDIPSYDNYTEGSIDDAYHNKLPHWSQNIVYYESVSIGDCLISGGSDYGQLPYFTETDDIILEIDEIKVAGLTSADIEEILSRTLTHSFKLVTGAHGLPLELREYLSRRFARGSVDHKLQELIRENIYHRTIPYTTREPRAGEVDGNDYNFVSKEQFLEMERTGLLLESGVYCNNYYGTPLPSCNSSNNKGNATLNGSVNATNNNSTMGSSSGLTCSNMSLASKRKRNRSNIAAIDASSLPYGWERISDAHYGVYFIDHINKRTQYERPYEIELVKGTSGFGFTLIEIDKGLVVVKSLIQGGAAQASGVIQSGDVLVSVAGVSVSGLQHSDIAHLFSTFNVGDRVRLTFARGYQLPMGFNDEDYDIITLKIVKGVQGFGFTISEGHNGQKVKKILDLERCCGLRQSDILLSINGIDLTALAHLDVVEALKQCPIDEHTEFMIKRKKRFRSKTPTQLLGGSESDINVPMRNCKTPGSEMFYQPVKAVAAGQYSEQYLIEDINNVNAVRMNGNGYDATTAMIPEYENSHQFISPYGALNSDSNPNLLANQLDYQYQQAQTNLKSHSAPMLTPASKPSNINPDDVMFGANNFDIDYEYHHVTLNRTETGFGFRIIGGSEEGSNVAIGSIVVGGAAYKDGVLKAADEIISINETNVMGASHQDVVQLMSQTGSLVRIIVRRKRYINSYDVTLYRQDYEGFGFVIISCGNCALIGRIIDGSPAHRCQRLHIRDRIIAVNAIDVTNLSHPEIVNKIKESGDTLHLRIIPADCYTVELIRGPNGYGFSIRGGAEYSGMPLFILCIANNGPATSLLQVGDEILEINDCSTVGMSHSDAVRLIGQSGPSVKLRLRRTSVANTADTGDLFNNFGSIGPSQRNSPQPPSLQQQQQQQQQTLPLALSSPQSQQSSPVISGGLQTSSSSSALAQQSVQSQPNNHLMLATLPFTSNSSNMAKFVPNLMNY